MDDHELSKIFSDTEIIPAPGEVVVHSGAANLWRGPEAVGGRLWLTGNWLVFRSHAVNVQRGVWAWPLRQIASIGPVNTLLVVPNGLEVVMDDGDRVRFVVNRRRAWMDAVEKAKG